MRAAFALGLLALAACSSPLSDSYVVKLDPAFRGQELEAARAAMADWRANAPVLLAEEVGACTGESFEICVRRAPVAEVERIAAEHGDPTPAGAVKDGETHGPSWPGGNSEVWVSYDAPDVGWSLRHTFAHEIGHALGLRHTGEGTLMCAWVECAARNVTPADVEQYLAIRR